MKPTRQECFIKKRLRDYELVKNQSKKRFFCNDSSEAINRAG